jgi:hypothetical protein
MHLEGVHLERIGQISNVLQCLYAKLNEETLVAFTGSTFIAGGESLSDPLGSLQPLCVLSSASSGNINFLSGVDGVFLPIEPQQW